MTNHQVTHPTAATSAKQPAGRLTPNVRPAAALDATPTRHPVLQLQRSAGNQAVLQVLRRSSSAAPADARGVPPIVRTALDGPARPLDAADRDFLEPRFGRDLGHVRIHSDTTAAESARAVGADAYTVGRDIVFAAGQHRPDTPQGRRLLAHELAHTLQQAAGPGVGSLSASSGIRLGDPRDAHEAAADRLADQVVRATGPAPVPAAATIVPIPGPTLQRQGFSSKSGPVYPVRKGDFVYIKVGGETIAYGRIPADVAGGFGIASAQTGTDTLHISIHLPQGEGVNMTFVRDNAAKALEAVSSRYYADIVQETPIVSERGPSTVLQVVDHLDDKRPDPAPPPTRIAAPVRRVPKNPPPRVPPASRPTAADQPVETTTSPTPLPPLPAPDSESAAPTPPTAIPTPPVPSQAPTVTTPPAPGPSPRADARYVEITPDMAKAMSDEELSRQMGRLHEYLANHPDDAAAAKNLAALENDAYNRQGTARESPSSAAARRPTPLSAAPSAEAEAARNAALRQDLFDETLGHVRGWEPPDPEVERVAELREDLRQAILYRKWLRAAELLNNFTPEHIQEKFEDLQPSQIESIYLGAIANPRVGDRSRVAQMSLAASPELAKAKETLEQTGVTMQEFLDYETRSNGDFWELHGFWRFYDVQSRVRALPWSVKSHLLVEPDITEYAQESGPPRTAAEEQAERIYQFSQAPPPSAVGATGGLIARIFTDDPDWIGAITASGNLVETGLYGVAPGRYYKDISRSEPLPANLPTLVLEPFNRPTSPTVVPILQGRPRPPFGLGTESILEVNPPPPSSPTPTTGLPASAAGSAPAGRLVVVRSLDEYRQRRAEAGLLPDPELGRRASASGEVDPNEVSGTERIDRLIKESLKGADLPKDPGAEPLPEELLRPRPTPPPPTRKVVRSFQEALDSIDASKIPQETLRRYRAAWRTTYKPKGPRLRLKDYIRFRFGKDTNTWPDIEGPLRELGFYGGVEQKAGGLLERTVNEHLPDGSQNAEAFPTPFGERIPDHLPPGSKTVYLNPDGTVSATKTSRPFSAAFVGESKYRDAIPRDRDRVGQIRGEVALASLSDQKRLVFYIRWKPGFSSPSSLHPDPEGVGLLVPLSDVAGFLPPVVQEDATRLGVRLEFVSDPNWR
jgi:hypothetical protein